MKELNQEIQIAQENMDEMVEELLEREEFVCTGNVSCGANACGAKDVSMQLQVTRHSDFGNQNASVRKEKKVC